MSIIELQDVSRDYNSTTGTFKQEKRTIHAVKSVSFKVEKGEIFGLLGPNGAGKSTLIKMMDTLLLPTEGSIKILGYNVNGDEKHIRPQINFITGGERSLYWRLTAKDNMAFFSDLYKVPYSDQKRLIPELLERVGLQDSGDQRVETFSKGMKQRLQIAKALINRPKVLFLDEPTIGLDPIGARMLQSIIREEAEKGTTIILTTHYMPEAEELCNRIGIINHGRLLALDSVNGLRTAGNHGTEATLEDIYIDMIGGEASA